MPHYKKKSPLRPKPTVSQNLPISKLCATARHSKTLRPIQMDRRANCRPRCDGADSRTRTDDLLITNELLYQLSHISIFDLILYDTPHIALTANDLLIYGQKYSRLARMSLSQFSLFLPFASSLHLPLAAVACSANELLYQLSHISI